MDNLWLYTIVYWLLVLCFVAPPDAFRSGGLTVQCLFSSYLGSEEMNFVGYNMKRTTITIVTHAALPMGYTLVGGLFHEPMNIVHLDRAPNWIKYYNLAAIACLTIGCVMAKYWTSKNWSRHPLARRLAVYDPDWRSVAASLNIEFRRVDKFVSRAGQAGARVYVTDTWIVKTSAHRVDVARQYDVHLNVLRDEQHAVAVDAPQSPVQYVWIEVRSVAMATTNRIIDPFVLRVNALELSDMKEKLSSPVRSARNVVVRATLSEQFAVAFREHVEKNPLHRVDLTTSTPDRCVGCMAFTSNVKLVKLCGDRHEGECVPCYCRPMWCFGCMAKWFASRQDQSRPETWLSSSASCPTCRAQFCVLDVCLIPGADQIPARRDDLDDD
ncbi:E3 ubiquitin-protein ligase TM129-like [Oscarella lobularis]|uniref:E3 ubiquitin-protein ligase TM129-like n=1 Tax=Oscarella lobularis TaxID=121494 RepID=UPI003313B53B